MPPPVRLGARKSPLARAQVDLVAAQLAALGLESTFVGVTTTGDVDRRHLTEIGGTGVFAGAVRDALRRRDIDLAVHSLKDLPTAPDPDLALVAVPEREDTRDVLVGAWLDDLPDGARIGTGAPRRALQLLDWARRTGRRIEIVPVRGNVDTRIELARSGTVDAVVLAAAGLQRLGHLDLSVLEAVQGGSEPGQTAESAPRVLVKGVPAQVLPASVMLPAPGQGALALEGHRDLAPDLAEQLARLDHATSHAEAVSERAFLGRLEAGCTAPVGARAAVKSVRGKSLDLTLDAVIGRTLLSNLSAPAQAGPPLRISARTTSSEPAAFGVSLAEQALAQLPEDTTAGQ